MNNRIQLHDTALTATTKMSDGNYGAASAMVQMIKEGERIDPSAAMGGLNSILLLDSFGIYGTDIYILFSDICERDVAKTIAVLRAVQLGFFDRSILKNACSRQDYSGKKMVPVDELYKKVQDRLPNFDRPAGAAQQNPKSFAMNTPNSSSVARIEYNADTKVFSIQFKSTGQFYDYPGVTQEDAVKARESKSYGALAKNELSKYTGKKRV